LIDLDNYTDFSYAELKFRFLTAPKSDLRQLLLGTTSSSSEFGFNDYVCTIVSLFLGILLAPTKDIGEKGGHMYQKIMVPLDGSELAECVLPHVETFIKEYKIKNVVFVRVVEPFHDHYIPATGIHDIEVFQKVESERKVDAEDYLNQIVNKLKHEEANLQTKVLTGTVSDSLCDYAESNDIDLILIATHGRSGVSRWVRGSVADKVLRSSNTPVLMVRVPGSKGGI